MKRLSVLYLIASTAVSLVVIVLTGHGPALWRALIGTSCDCEDCHADRYACDPVADDEVAR